MPPLTALLLAFALTTSIQGSNGAAEYYGRFIGPLSRLVHSVSGDVYAVDARTLHIRDFTYDGEGPAAFFYAGNSKAPGPGGFIIRDETGSNGVLKRYNGKHITITLPEGKTLHSIKWFSVWCEEFQVNFGDIQIPRGLDFPKPQKIGALNGVHAVSSESIVVVDAQTLLIPSFSYDGEAPDAKFWVGRGPKPSPQGIRVPDENGKINPLRRYDRKTIVLTLPGDLTIFDIGHFGVWCEAFTVDFGHVQIPQALNVPPSLKMLGVSPQSKLNCEVLSDDLAYEVRWAIAGDSVVIQLVAKLENGEYMSFGLSGDEKKSVMIGGDVVVAWVDQNTLNGYAHDYYLDSKSQCSGPHGSCPDFKLEQNTESVRLLNAALVNGYSIVTYQRPLKAHDDLDKAIITSKSQPVIWAVGPLNSRLEVSYHSVTSKGDLLFDFGRPPKWNCPIPEADAVSSDTNKDQAQHETIQNTKKTQPPTTEATTFKTPPPPSPASKARAWFIPPIQCNEPDDRVFYAQLGPTGGKQGYPAITGHVGWGIAYYINGLLIPELNLVRGQTYTFVVESGMDADFSAKYHPFYITDDPIGGYRHKTPEERRKVNIYAGAELNKHGEVVPTGIGRLCNWKPDPNQPEADHFASFGAFQRILTLVCDFGDPAIIQWTPDKHTPDTVYYQCFEHRYLGWKINILDSCDLPTQSGSEPVPSLALPEIDELQANPSILVSTRVQPDFTSQNIAESSHKNFSSFGFPYEIVKPAYNVKRVNVSNEHIIPVREEIEDVPESTTIKILTTTNASYEIPAAMPLIKGPPPQVRPNHQGPMPNFNRGPPRRPVVIRRPVPFMKHQNPHMNRPMNVNPMIHQAGSQSRPVVVKKPIMRLPQRPMMVYHQRPAIGPMQMNKPNQQQIQSQKPVYVHKFKKPTQPHVTPAPEKVKKIHPSQMMSQTKNELTTKLPIAVNTGFNPGSLVIESGFKPIIQTPHAQERISEVEYDEDDEEEGVIKVENLEDQKSQTEMFEPMFIPSPLDSNVKHTKKATTEPVKKIRKPNRHVIHRRPIYNEPVFRSDDGESISFYLSDNPVNYDKRNPLPANHKLHKDTPIALPLEGKENSDKESDKDEVATTVSGETESAQEPKEREKRSAHHEPGHEDHDHNHEHHEHENQKMNNGHTISPFFIFSLISVYFVSLF